jgi:hypothetical protein
MGLENNNRAIFLSIGDGKITRRVQAPTKDSKQRTTKQGKVVNEEIYDAISGLIVDIKVYDHKDFGKFWNIYLQDGEDVYVLQTNYSGGYSSAFLKALPNVNLAERVRIIPSLKVEGTKKKVTLFVNQGGHALKHAYTKDNPNGLPQMVQVKVKGQLQWDDSDMMEFLEKMVNEKVLPKLKKAGAVVAAKAPVPVEAEEEDSTEDLPF